MNLNHQVFTGIFNDEIGQRFLKILSTASDYAFRDLYEQCVPNNNKRLKECLVKVRYWDKSVINEEFSKLFNKFNDINDIFKQSYISYVKLLKGNNNVKIMVNLPKIEDFLHSCLIQFSENNFLKDGKYFDFGPLDQKCICMTCIRDALHEYIGNEYVKIEGKRSESKISSTLNKKTIPETKYYSEGEDSIGPDDSVSQLGYRPEKRTENKFKETTDNKQKEDDSISLSSVTLSNTERRSFGKSDKTSHTSRQKDGFSEASSVKYTRCKSDDKRNEYEFKNKQNEEDKSRKNDDRYDDRNGTHRSLKYDNKYDNRSESHVSRRYEDIYDDKSETHRSRKYDDERSRKYDDERSRKYDDERSRKYDDERSDTGRNQTHRNHTKDDEKYEIEESDEEEKNIPNAKQSEDSSSSEEENHDQKRVGSPCKSYVTQLTNLTERSRMTNE